MRRLLGFTLLALVASCAPPAGARKFQMSGNWVVRNGQVFILQLVADGLGYRYTKAGQTPCASAHRICMTLSAPVPSLSPGAFVAAGALVLLAAGYALQRRRAARTGRPTRA